MTGKIYSTASGKSKGKLNVVRLDVGVVAFAIIGISSHENDYRLSWSINEQLGLAFAKAENVITSDGREFSCFVHEYDKQPLLLISNRCDNGFLLEKYKNFDYILKFNTELNETEIAERLGDLRSVPLISAAFHIPMDKKILRLLS